VNFIVDAQLPPALKLWLIQLGHTAAHVDDVGLGEAEDLEIWRYALSTDADF
jgi:predicted nuclease of predicted toxin-antitoxin system